MAGTLALPTLVQKFVLDASKGIADAKKVEGQFARTGREAGRLNSTVKQSGSAFRIGSVAMLAASAALVVGLKKAVSGAAEYAQTVFRIKGISGDTAEASSKFVFVLERLGISVDRATRPLILLSRNVVQGGKSFTQYFNSAQIATLKTGTLTEKLGVLQDAYGKLAPGTERTVFLTNTLGTRSGFLLRRLVALGRDGYAKVAAEAQKFGLVLTENNLAAFIKFADESRAVGQAFKGLQVQIGLALLPTFLTLDKALVKGITTFTGMPTPIKNVATNVLVLGTVLGLLYQAAKFVGPGFALMGKAFALVNTGLVALIPGLGALETEIGLLPLRAQLAVLSLNEMTISEILAGEAAIGLAGALSLIGAAAIVGGAFGAAIEHFIIAPIIRGNEKAHDLDAAFNETKDTFELLGKEGKIPQKAVGVISKELEKYKGHSAAARRAQARLFSADAIALIARVAKKHGDVVTVVKLLARGQRDAAFAAAGESSALHDNASAADESAAAHALLVAGVEEVQTRMRSEQDALDAVGQAVTQHGENSKEAKDATVAYAKALVDAAIAAAGGKDKVKDLAQVQADAESKAASAAQAAVDAAEKEAVAVEEARQQEIQSNLDLIQSLGQLADKRKEEIASAADALSSAEQKLADARDKVAENQRFLVRTPDRDKELAKLRQEVADAQKDVAKAKDDATKAAHPGETALDKLIQDTSVGSQAALVYVSNLKAIAAAGGGALAAEIAKMGPEGAAAAAAAVAEIGTVGFANLEKTAEDAIIIAKIAADAQWDKWKGNFAEKAALASDAAFNSLVGKLKDFAKQHPEFKVEVEAEITRLTLGVQAQALASGLSFAFHTGGQVTPRGAKFHSGGSVGGVGREVASILETNEHVINRRSAIGLRRDYPGLLESMNSYHAGGAVVPSRGQAVVPEVHNKTTVFNIAAVHVPSAKELETHLERRARLQALVGV